MGGADNLAGKAVNFFKELGERFKNLGLGVNNIFKGVGEEFEGVIEGTGIFIEDILNLVITSYIFLGSNIICGIYFLGNIKECFIYYILQMIGTLLYLPVRIFVWFFKTINIVNLQPVLDKIWEIMEKIDIIIYKYFKFHIIHFPKSVREKCFVCKRLKTDVIADVGGQMASDLVPPDGRIVRPFTNGINNMTEGGKQISRFFAPW
jgi:hypothetical protein